jgi:diacylglycerol kinase family enzyme
VSGSGRSSDELSPSHRAYALVALVAFAAAVVLLAVRVVDGALLALALAVVLAISLMSAWVAVTRRGPVRALASVIAVALVAGVVVTLIIKADWSRVGLIVVLFVMSALAARKALGVDARVLTSAPPPGRPVGAAANGVLIMNLRSGGGKAERFDLVEECHRRGIEPIVLGKGDDLEQLAKDAVAGGADVIGMAGGDGSQALVASVAASADVAYVCIPAGTRNHFALDLGLDREDVVGALDAFAEAVERRIDLATINGRTFVNNVSIGVYAEVVQSDEYRDAKFATTVQKLPELLGPDAEPFDLRFDGPDGRHHDTATIIQVSNNSYELHSFTGVGSRPRIDRGVLGIVTLHIERAADVPALIALAQAGRADRFAGFEEWESTSFRIEAADPIPAGVDGEALSMDPPLEFEIQPGALRVRIPLDAPGWAPAALAQARGRFTIVDLVRVVIGRPSHARPQGTSSGEDDPTDAGELAGGRR